MQTAENNEEKRNKTWRIVMIVATILIIIVAVYFLYRGFLGNPLEGKWQNDESNLVIEIGHDDTAILTWDEPFEGSTLKVNLNYTLNKKGKQITFKAEQDELEKAAKSLDGDVTAQQVETAVKSMLTSFNYNLESNELTLTEWDYGDQYLFSKVK